MVHKPTAQIRFTSGALAGVNIIASQNRDGSVSFKNQKGQMTNIDIPNITKGTFAVGSGGLPSPDGPVIIASPSE